MSLLNDKIRGSLIGGAIGDALGYIIEFEVGIKDKQQMKYEGIGHFSDDTQLTLFTANSIIWHRTQESLNKRNLSISDSIFWGYQDWYDTQSPQKIGKDISWIKKLPGLHSKRAPGFTCMSALASGKKGTIKNILNYSKGCGGVMRVAPIGMYFKDSKEAGRLGAEASAITHGHPLGIIPGYILAVIINSLIYTDSTIEQAINNAIELFNSEFAIFDLELQRKFLDLINLAIKLSSENISDTEAIKIIGRGWNADEALAIAIYSSLKYSTNFQDAIVCAVNHDGDSDSTGAIAGNIVGAYLGYSKIPPYYVENLELKDIVLELADDLSMPVPSLDKDEYWVSKYIQCKRNIALKDKNDSEKIKKLC